MSSEYRALVGKVEAFTSAAFERRGADMQCAEGCSSCCEVSLTVSGVEAAEVRVGLASLPAADRIRVAQRAEQQAQATRCVMLESDGRCIIYEHRPLVCRTQGHALRYPEGFIPENAVRARTSRGPVTHCPLNFTATPPNAEDVLDAERVDELLAVVAHRFALTNAEDPSKRTALTELALRP
jgi:uncharacterized protein